MYHETIELELIIPGLAHFIDQLPRKVTFAFLPNCLTLNSIDHVDLNKLAYWELDSFGYQQLRRALGFETNNVQAFDLLMKTPHEFEYGNYKYKTKFCGKTGTLTGIRMLKNTQYTVTYLINGLTFTGEIVVPEAERELEYIQTQLPNDANIIKIEKK